ncbi:DUF2911 domain-containing protein [Hanstruepera ponticola]|uniref:DUF2911 domain-containing protein n=1 Tax=Hanstruepera ponticola TaxID=2042995 RepID=UPI000CF1525C|nr:DUF2911 domain-containing protein [Hanstruepera ponticola]
MNKLFKWFFGFLLIVAIGLFCYSYFIDDSLLVPRKSPIDTVTLVENDLQLDVVYNRPSKRGREIFGGLVPYKEVWRTGANEATTFKTNKPLKINNDSLPAGKYTLWTIPNDSTWQIMFNTKQYAWGVDKEMKPMREPEFDIISLAVPVQHINKTVEQFTIGFDNTLDVIALTMAWDKTKIEVPIETFD